MCSYDKLIITDKTLLQCEKIKMDNTVKQKGEMKHTLIIAQTFYLVIRKPWIDRWKRPKWVPVAKVTMYLTSYWKATSNKFEK